MQDFTSGDLLVGPSVQDLDETAASLNILEAAGSPASPDTVNLTEGPRYQGLIGLYKDTVNFKGRVRVMFWGHF